MAHRKKKERPNWAVVWLPVITAALACVTAALYTLAAWFHLVSAIWTR